MVTTIIVILVSLLCSGFFSAMELAFLNQNRLKTEIDRGHSKLFDYISSIFSKNQGQYITTILVGNNIMLVIYSMYMSLLIRTILVLIGQENLVEHGSILLETIIPTIIVVFVAEYIPKAIIRANPNFYYRIFSPVIYVVYLILYPIAYLTTGFSYLLLRLLGQKKSSMENISFNKSDIESLLAPSSSSQEEEDAEIKMFHNALDFADLRVRDCMVPRIDVEAVDIDDTSIEDLTARFVETMYSRIMVYRGSIDNIIGYVNSKTLFRSPKSIEDALIKVQFVSETLPLQDMLQKFIKKHSNIAVVIDEFGGTAGIISLEDVLEEIFGEIEDEHDTPDLVEKQNSENEWVLSCRLEIQYLNEKYGLDIPESEEYDTLAGYIISRSDSLPHQGEEIAMGNLRFKILRTTKSRLELAKVNRVE